MANKKEAQYRFHQRLFARLNVLKPKGPGGEAYRSLLALGYGEKCYNGPVCRPGILSQKADF
ncbi:MAG: hypothetical protein LBT38_11175 [Deltaproteobacteria bacterium]|jgi:hypothetical protein|nr:hypothetical protein [Deltaproteobacteria bacterium]